MPRASIDKEALYKLVKKGHSATEIMDELGIATKQTLKAALADIMIDKGEVLQVPGMKGRRTGKKKINKNGMQLSKNLLCPPFEVGDSFSIKVDSESITLTKV